MTYTINILNFDDLSTEGRCFAIIRIFFLLLLLSASHLASLYHYTNWKEERRMQSFSSVFLIFALCLCVFALCVEGQKQDSSASRNDTPPQQQHLRTPRRVTISPSELNHSIPYEESDHPYVQHFFRTRRQLLQVFHNHTEHKKAWMALAEVDGLKNEEVAMLVTSTDSQGEVYLWER